MGKPKEIWYSYAKNMVKIYRKRATEYNALCASTGDPAATLPGSHQKEYDAVTQAIAITQGKRNGKDRLAVVDMVLFSQSRTIAGAADKLHFHEATASKYHRQFIQLVADCYGLSKGSEQ